LIDKIICKIRGQKYGIRVDMASQGNLNYYKRQCVRYKNMLFIKENIFVSKRNLSSILKGEEETNWEGFQKEF